MSPYPPWVKVVALVLAVSLFLFAASALIL